MNQQLIMLGLLAAANGALAAMTCRRLKQAKEDLGRLDREILSNTDHWLIAGQHLSADDLPGDRPVWLYRTEVVGGHGNAPRLSLGSDSKLIGASLKIAEPIFVTPGQNTSFVDRCVIEGSR